MYIFLPLLLWHLGVSMVNGLDFEVNKLQDNPEFVDSCAILMCEVDSEKHPDVAYIERMTLFNHSTRHTKEAMATVSAFQPRITKDCNANPITATFTAHRADIKFLVNDITMCQAGIFSCEVKYLSVDGHGKIKDLFRDLEGYESTGPGIEYEGFASDLDNRFGQLEALSQKIITSLDKLEKEVTCEAPSGNWPREIIKPREGIPFLCDTATGGGGWTIIQRRVIGDVDFNRTWADYKMGFGSLTGDFWLGNDNIHSLTSKKPHELRIDMFHEFKHYYAYYSSISVDNESNKYKLEIGDYSGTAGNSLSYHNNMKFSTYDQDNDKDRRKCSVEFGGGWWYNGCHRVNLNGIWDISASEWTGLSWKAITADESVWSCEIKIRPRKS